jgi:hypothetical protein
MAKTGYADEVRLPRSGYALSAVGYAGHVEGTRLTTTLTGQTPGPGVAACRSGNVQLG